MIPLVLAAIGFGVGAYFVQRWIRHKPVSLGGVLAAALVSGLTAGIGGPVLDALWGAGIFAGEGAIAGEVENLVTQKNKKEDKKLQENGTAGSSGTANSGPGASSTPYPYQRV